eukprot:403339275
MSRLQACFKITTQDPTYNYGEEKCYFQILMVIMSSVLPMMMSFILFIQYKYAGNFKEFYFNIKTQVLLIAFFAQIDVALHYTVYPDWIITYSLVLMESLRFFAMFLVCYFYSQKSTNFIPSHKKWLMFLRVFMAINFIWQLTVFVLSEMNYQFAFENNRLLCKTYVFLMLRTSGELASFVFMIIGIIITRNVWELLIINQKSQVVGVTKYDKNIVGSQRKAILKLWIIIISFVIISVFFLAYDVITYETKNCEAIIDNKKFANSIIWFFARSLTYIFWAIPIVYLFWPKLRKFPNKHQLFLRKEKKANKKKLQKLIQKNKLLGHQVLKAHESNINSSEIFLDLLHEDSSIIDSQLVSSEITQTTANDASFINQQIFKANKSQSQSFMKKHSTINLKSKPQVQQPNDLNSTNSQKFQISDASLKYKPKINYDRKLQNHSINAYPESMNSGTDKSMDQSNGTAEKIINKIKQQHQHDNSEMSEGDSQDISFNTLSANQSRIDTKQVVEDLISSNKSINTKQVIENLAEKSMKFREPPAVLDSLPKSKKGNSNQPNSISSNKFFTQLQISRNNQNSLQQEEINQYKIRDTLSQSIATQFSKRISEQSDF